MAISWALLLLPLATAGTVDQTDRDLAALCSSEVVALDMAEKRVAANAQIRRAGVTGTAIENAERRDEASLERARAALDECSKRVAPELERRRAKRQAEAEARVARERAAAEEAAKKKAEEDARAQADREEATKHEGDLQKLRENATVLRYEWSALVCFWKDWRRASRREAEKEKRYGAEFGAVSLDKLYRERQQAELADARTKAALDQLRALKAQPLPCNDKFVNKVFYCIWEGAQWCGDDSILLDLAYELDPELSNAR